VITDAEVLRMARSFGVEPLVVDHDHALGVVLWALAAQGIEEAGWILKGGTCLRKLHFPGYRFSEDLDFTVRGALDAEVAAATVVRMHPRAREHGIELITAELRYEIMNTDEGRETVVVTMPYRGTHRYRGSPRRIQFHLSADELLIFPVERPSLIHPYSDAADVACHVPSYALEEVVAEKLRAICGQRQFPVARDLYDIARLTSRPVDVDAALDAVPAKAAFKGVAIGNAAEKLIARRPDLAANWKATLTYLTPSGDGLSFDQAFETCHELLLRLESSLKAV
jgi:predicted nucleotidyltransferase component of viral defense system